MSFGNTDLSSSATWRASFSLTLIYTFTLLSSSFCQLIPRVKCMQVSSPWIPLSLVKQAHYSDILEQTSSGPTQIIRSDKLCKLEKYGFVKKTSNQLVTRFVQRISCSPGLQPGEFSLERLILLLLCSTGFRDHSCFSGNAVLVEILKTVSYLPSLHNDESPSALLVLNRTIAIFLTNLGERPSRRVPVH